MNLHFDFDYRQLHSWKPETIDLTCITSTFQAYDPELFSKALPCLTAIGCAFSPDYSLTNQDDSWYNQVNAEVEGVYNPHPVDTSR